MKEPPLYFLSAPRALPTRPPFLPPAAAAPPSSMAANNAPGHTSFADLFDFGGTLSQPAAAVSLAEPPLDGEKDPRAPPHYRRARLFATALLLISLLALYLWTTAGTRAGTLSRTVWYITAVAQAWLLFCFLATVPGTARHARTMAALLLLPLSAPLLNVVLYETLQRYGEDRGQTYVAPIAWVGRVLAAATVFAAGAILVAPRRTPRSTSM